MQPPVSAFSDAKLCGLKLLVFFYRCRRIQICMCELEKSTFLKEDPISSRLLALLGENCRGVALSFPTCQPGLFLELVLLESGQFQDFSEGKFSSFSFSPSYIFCFFHFKKIFAHLFCVCPYACGVGDRCMHMPGKAQRRKCPSVILCVCICTTEY